MPASMAVVLTTRSLSIVVEQQEVGQQHAQALEQVAALDVAGDHRHRDAGCVPARRATASAIGESGSIASMPGTRCGLVRFFAMSITTRLNAE